MKRLMIALIVVVCFSCSSSDDDNSNSDLIIGTWKPLKSNHYNNGDVDEYTFSVCQQNSRYTYTSDGKFEYIEYSTDNAGNCTSENTHFSFISGFWEKISATKYKLTSSYFYYDTQITEVEVDVPDIVFPDSNTFHLTYTNEEHNESDTTVFMRVE